MNKSKEEVIKGLEIGLLAIPLEDIKSRKTVKDLIREVKGKK